MALAFMPSGGTRWVGSHADCPSDPLADGDRVSGTGSVTSPDGPDGSVTHPVAPGGPAWAKDRSGVTTGRGGRAGTGGA